MAFCPHCGTRLGAQASACAACGAEIDAAPAAGANRFKGTMMMAPASLRPPGDAGQPNASGHARAPQPAQQRPPAGRPNGTMLGGLMPPTAPKGGGAPIAPRAEQDLGPGSPGKPAAFNATILGGITAPGDSSPPPRPPQRPAQQRPSPHGTAPSGYPGPAHGNPGHNNQGALGHAPTAMAAAALGQAPTEAFDMNMVAGGEQGFRAPPGPRGPAPFGSTQVAPPADPPHQANPAHHPSGYRSPDPHGFGQPHSYHPHQSAEPPPRGEPSQRLLVGDPMAGNSGMAPAGLNMDDSRPRMDDSRPRMDVSRQRNTRRGSHMSGLLWVAVGFVGMLAIAGLGVLAAKMLGLL